MGLLGDLFSVAAEAGSSLRKATSSGGERLEHGRGPGVTLLADPGLWAVSGMRYRDKPALASYDTLRFLCKRDTLLASIIYTRLRQIKAFSRLRTHEEAEKTNNTGYRVRLRAGAGERTQAVEAKEDELNKFISRCGREDIQPHHRSFGEFLWMFTKDRLEIDQACAEIRLDRGGRPIEFYAVDGATIRVIDPTRKRKGPMYLQMFEGRPVATLNDQEMMFCPENLTTELKMSGYSIAETEIAVKKTMAHLGIDETNYRQFQPGSMPKGVLALNGADMSEEQTQIFEHKWKNQVTGFRGKHRLPFIPLPRGGKLEFLHFPQATDIEFGNFLDYLVNMLTALYGMDPSEINFPNRGGGIAGANPMISSAPEATRLTASRDKGLRTLLAFLEDKINGELLSALDDSGDFEFAFVGFDRQSDSERADLEGKQASVWRTVNQIRESHGEDPIDGGDIILNPTWVQSKQMEQMGQQQEGMGEGAGGEEGTEKGWEAPDEPEDEELW